MDIEFLGTGASDWDVSLRDTSGYRRFSSALIGGRLLIDPGPHIFGFTEDFNCAGLLENAGAVIVTHSHGDHLDLKSVSRLCSEGVNKIYCEEHVAPILSDVKNIDIHIMPLFEKIEICGFGVTAVPANHGTEICGEQAVHYIAEKDGKRMFYGCDGAWIRRDAWYYMRNYAYDLFVLDGTLGDDYGDYRIFEHNNLRMAEIIAETIKNTGVLKDGGKIILSHFAHGCHGTQAELEKRLAPFGISAAYDGMRIDI